LHARSGSEVAFQSARAARQSRACVIFFNPQCRHEADSAEPFLKLDHRSESVNVVFCCIQEIRTYDVCSKMLFHTQQAVIFFIMGYRRLRSPFKIVFLAALRFWQERGQPAAVSTQSNPVDFDYFGHF
jgi:hypothetical protein